MSDQEFVVMSQEHQIIMVQNRQELQDERGKREKLQNQLDQSKYENASKETKLIEGILVKYLDYTSRENSLRLRLQN